VIGFLVIVVAVDRHIILREPTLCTVDLKSAGVGTGESRIKSQANDLPEFCGKNSGDNVALRPLAVSIGLIAVGMILDICIKSRALGGEGGKTCELIAVTDSEKNVERAELVGGIVLAIAAAVVAVAVMTVYKTHRDLLTKIVAISAAKLNEITEESVSVHRVKSLLNSAVAAVFKHHCGRTGLAVSLAKFYALVDGVSTANLECNGLLRSHSRDCRGNVVFPSREDEYDLDLGRCDEFLIVQIDLGIVSEGRDLFLHGITSVLIFVTDSGDEAVFVLRNESTH
jgi:hypothetical protein